MNLKNIGRYAKTPLTLAALGFVYACSYFSPSNILSSKNSEDKYPIQPKTRIERISQENLNQNLKEVDVPLVKTNYGKWEEVITSDSQVLIYTPKNLEAKVIKEGIASLGLEGEFGATSVIPETNRLLIKSSKKDLQWRLSQGIKESPIKDLVYEIDQSPPRGVISVSVWSLTGDFTFDYESKLKMQIIPNENTLSIGSLISSILPGSRLREPLRKDMGVEFQLGLKPAGSDYEFSYMINLLQSSGYANQILNTNFLAVEGKQSKIKSDEELLLLNQLFLAGELCRMQLNTRQSQLSLQ